VARMSGRLMNASHRLIPACSDVCRPTSRPLPTITTRKTAAVSMTAMAICRVRFRRRGTVSFLPDTTRSVVSIMALHSVLFFRTVAGPPANFQIEARSSRNSSARCGPAVNGRFDHAPSIGGSHRPDAVLLVDIAAELDDAVLRRPCRDIDKMQRHRLLQRHIATLAALFHLSHMLGPPALVGEHPGRELFDAVHAHATGTRRTEVAPEQRLGGRVVHVDGMRIVEINLDKTEGIFGAWLLTVCQALC